MSCFLSILAWLVIILTWVWVATRPQGTFHDQGGLMLTFIVLPLTFGAWAVGGPVALAVGGHAMKHLGQDETARSDRRIAQTGVFLSRLLFWGGVIWLVTMIFVAIIT
jgi:hypothetical protein